MCVFVLVCVFDRMDSLEDQCPIVPCSNARSLLTYYSSAENIFKLASRSLDSLDFVSAYVYFKRFANLVLQTMPRHNAYNQPQWKPEKKKLREMAVKALNVLEDIRPKVKTLVELRVNEDEKDDVALMARPCMEAFGPL